MKRAVSLVHDCTDTCTFEERDSSRRIERKFTNEKALHFKHDSCNIMYCLNVYRCLMRIVTCFFFQLCIGPLEYKIH